jgi:predicted dehydrogenase
VPDHLHYETTIPLIENGLHCLVVKPLAPTVKEVKGLIRLAEKAGVYGAVEFHKRFDRSNLKLRDTIQQGLIGDPLYFVVEYSQRKSIPLKKFKEWVRHTNILQYLGIHYIDIIFFATGASPRRAMAQGQKSFLIRRGVDTFDAIQCLIEWEMKNGSRFTSAIMTNWIDPEKTSAMSDQRIKVIGTRGRFEADQKYRGIRLVTDEKGVEELNPDFSVFYGTGSGDGVSFQGYGAESILQFLKDVTAVKAGKLKPIDLKGRRPTFRDALAPTAVLEAANKSLALDGKWVEIK